MSNVANPEELVVSSSSESKQVVFEATVLDEMLLEIMLMESLFVLNFTVGRIYDV